MNTGIVKPENRSVWTKVGRLSCGNRSYSIRSGLDFALGCFVMGLDFLRFGIYNIKIYLNKPLIFWVMDIYTYPIRSLANPCQGRHNPLF
jgi:hypothetical protein